MAVVNPMFNLANVKDSRWLTLEVCREFQRNKCTRTELECKFAHPPPHVEVQNGRVTCCFDSIKGKCQRKDPPCKYLHPPQHLREQLLQNGRNNLILKNLQMQAMAAGGLPAQPMVPGMIPTVQDQRKLEIEQNPYILQMYDASGKPVSYPTSVIHGQYPSLVSSASQSCLPGQFEHFWDLPGYQQANPYMTIGNAGFNPYISTSVPGAVSMIPTADGSSVIHTGGQLQGVMQGGGSSAAAAAAAAAKQPRADRLEVCREFQRGTCSRQPCECRYAHPPENVTVDTTDNHVTVCMDYVKGKCSRETCRYFHPPPHLQAQIKAAQQRANAAAAQAQALGMTAVPGMVPYVKRTAVADSKSGVPMYQPGSGTATYQQALAMQQQLQQHYVPVTIAGHPPSVPRF